MKIKHLKIKFWLFITRLLLNLTPSVTNICYAGHVKLTAKCYMKELESIKDYFDNCQ